MTVQVGAYRDRWSPAIVAAPEASDVTADDAFAAGVRDGEDGMPARPDQWSEFAPEYLLGHATRQALADLDALEGPLTSTVPPEQDRARS